MSCGKTSPPYCEEQQKRVTALLQQIKDYETAQRDQSGFGYLAIQATLLMKYGVTGTPGPLDILEVNTDLEGAQADLAQCRISHGLEEFGTVGKLAAKVTNSLYKYFTT